MPKSAQVTAAEISRIAGVTRATVSNWRRRHEDFPAPSGGTESSPLYDLEPVRAWLESRGHTAAANPAEELRTSLRLHGPGSGIATRMLPLVLAAARRDKAELTKIAELPDSDLASRADAACTEVAEELPAGPAARFQGDEADALRALLVCVRDADAQSALRVLAERELEDSASTGTYETPSAVAELLTALALRDSDAVRHQDDTRPVRVLDPACGSGSLLRYAAHLGANALYGQDTVPVQALRTAVRLLLQAPDAEVAVRDGDSLRADSFPELLADAVVCNPPYGDRDWGHDELTFDQRWAYGVPARGESELAWVQHALAHLVPGGFAALLLPPAVASRGSGRRIRAELVRSGALRAVISLPQGVAPPAHIALQVWMLQRPEPGGPDRKSVLFVEVDDAQGKQGQAGSVSGRTPAGRTQTRWAKAADAALAAWSSFLAAPDSFADTPGNARAVPLVELLDDYVDLTPARQVKATPLDIAPAEQARQTAARRDELVAHIGLLTEATDAQTWLPAGASAREWRTATVTDLARGGAVEVLRAAPDAKEKAEATPSPAPKTRPVLTGADIARGARATADGAGGTARGESLTVTGPVIAEGDVLVRAVGGGSGPMTRVADAEDAGAVLGRSVFLLRPDADRLDPWFLAGFLSTADNLAGASSGSTTLHISAGRLRVPLLPVDEQRRYGIAFRRVHELRTTAVRTAELAERTAESLLTGLTAGALMPPESPGGPPARKRN
ncbi:N-6 DNA methylase [Streptomyces sp. NBC_01304]|uniref:N-6 DNA methylase n=1 Tax=Streptomyces sp. NBC_01304 TaxID=2903818 RepID=UPI002E114053|nr:N-6 DNA methylase [Streptomyces sp. NBC_01304]